MAAGKPASGGGDGDGGGDERERERAAGGRGEGASAGRFRPRGRGCRSRAPGGRGEGASPAPRPPLAPPPPARLLERAPLPAETRRRRRGPCGASCPPRAAAGVSGRSRRAARSPEAQRRRRRRRLRLRRGFSAGAAPFVSLARGPGGALWRRRRGGPGRGGACRSRWARPRAHGGRGLEDGGRRTEVARVQLLPPDPAPPLGADPGAASSAAPAWILQNADEGGVATSWEDERTRAWAMLRRGVDSPLHGAARWAGPASRRLPPPAPPPGPERLGGRGQRSPPSARARRPGPPPPPRPCRLHVTPGPAPQPFAALRSPSPRVTLRR
ncbi:unnamed protein product [Nyctereutes procyonoides]|uniref:(raccoon dog) hypothetical protein n=1 Tax=Nyctereutes procyonoides TaxID=34880 RepID=A0A811Y761_NYCPR|nr:unnamed protein product [Nyctereutes procyonoides]